MSDSNLYCEFNKCIKEIFKTFKDLPSQKFKSKLHIGEMQSKLVQGMNAEEKYAMTYLGDYVFRAREHIVAENADFFLNRRYDIELMQLSKKHNFDYENALDTVAFMKDAYRNAPVDKQREIFRLFKVLLKIYSQSKISEKKTST